MNNMNMIAELKIQNGMDRAELVKILTFAGYGVQIKERQNPDNQYKTDYYVQIYAEEKMSYADLLNSKCVNKFKESEC